MMIIANTVSFVRCFVISTEKASPEDVFKVFLCLMRVELKEFVQESNLTLNHISLQYGKTSVNRENVSNYLH